MNQLCANIIGHLNSKGLYAMLQCLLLKGLARKKPSFSHAALSAIFTLAIRPVIISKCSDNLMSLFLLYIMSVPGLVLHLQTTSKESITVLQSENLFKHSLDYLSLDQNTRIIFNSLEGNYALCLLSNIIHLGYIEQDKLIRNVASFTRVVHCLLMHCQNYVGKKKSNTSQWHPVLGWFSQSIDHSLHESMEFVLKQLSKLWSRVIVEALFDDALKAAAASAAAEQEKATQKEQPKGLLRKLQRTSLKLTSRPTKSLNTPEVVTVCGVCDMFQTAMSTLTEIKANILSGLTYKDDLLPSLWHFITELGPNSGIKLFLESLDSSVESQPILSLLMFFCDCSTYLITILDDVEVYEHQKPFKLDDLVNMSSFLNMFIYKMIWDHNIDSNSRQHSLFVSTHPLLMLLHQRDARRSFTPDNHWLIKDLKMSLFRNELERGSKRAKRVLQIIPHVIPHIERVILFRKKVGDEKKELGFVETAGIMPHSTLITIKRSQLVEDGYQQIGHMDGKLLKGTIRVKFVNRQGLEEAGIDQDGVFKEFLEEIIKKVFNPELNLFRHTEDQRLYPSPTSFIHENHLSLFEFVGKMLAKAIYEGIVVEVPFASFFLSQMVDHQHSALYSPLDELPSMDKDLFKNLSFLKHYDEDVADLDLVFSYDEDVMGKIVTHELIPGGKAIGVTNENRIRYVHLMAHFKMRYQIRDQVKAFKNGFCSVVNPEWLSWFTTPELQRLISGDNVAIDLSDLKKHVLYYGGFHSGHKVVVWLWDILEKDFNREERALFLKFVTSCSKPPLLGFVHLQPPFSIRCVEVSDDQDTGDTLGSVVRGFLGIHRRDPVGRLPTSSTCFNLLKLPNYSRKSTLKEKLRYAITSGTGFELS
ncbi:ubiquitin-protein ligase E3B-like [Anneissia japonica]|uniref:ubiquitin-protein ligase E3B-like n=1 Tax=Anneissia japonica TaxID=1529436 RepID=UPI001425530F|nr:ubiquitin-protein ligase E3B-like [Anneissia japonica]